MGCSSSTEKKLDKLNADDISLVPHKKEEIKAKVVSVYDGDTVTCIFLHGKKVPMKINVRIRGIDAPEMKSKNPLETKAAMVVKHIVSSMIKDEMVKLVIIKWDKYGGRIVGDIYYKNKGNECSLSDFLLGAGLVKPYDGTKKKEPWENKELRIIMNT